MAEQRVALYLRLSRDDERLGESMSIENQRSYLTQYARGRGWEVCGVYVDDGCSGTSFDRPGFLRLLDDVEAGRVNTVLTKDLSRLGRDQIGTAYYYQIYFPRHQVRYIAAAEGFDTAEPGASSALFPFLTAANDFYTADISRKVRAALTTRKREGKFIGSSPPLGYQKDPLEPGRLIAEPGGAEIVRRLFALYLQTGSVLGCAKRLTELGVPTPAQYKKGPAPRRFPGVWSDTMVRRILTNPTYAGHLTQNRREKLNYKVEQRLTLPKSAWITVPHTHEPLVSQAEFDQVQALLAVRGYAPRGGAAHLLTGLAFCADCGSPMTYQREGDTRCYMVCQGYRRGGRLHLCTSHCIREEAVLQAIREALRARAAALDPGALGEALRARQSARPRPRRAPSPQRRLEQLDAVLERLYRDRAEGVLLEQEFQTLLRRNRAERARWEAGAGGPGQPEPPSPPDPTAQIRRLLSFASLDRAAAAALLERVLIHGDKSIEIFFRFCEAS